MDRVDLAASFLPPAGAAPVSWITASAPVEFGDAMAAMDRRVAGIAAGHASEAVWLLEHAPIYTAGTSARESDLHDARFPIHRTGRGGQYTYHGPGQRIAYVMLDLKRRNPDVRAFVAALERWIIGTLASFGIQGRRHEERVGVWVRRPGSATSEDKIAALGIRVRSWVSLHGIALNVEPDLSHYAGIVPCGVADARLGVTSLAALGVQPDLRAVDAALRQSFGPIFGPTVDGDPSELG